MPNLSNILSRNNKIKLQKFKNQDLPAQRACDCRDEPCPMDGNCLESEVIYQASVKRLDNGDCQKYIGLTGGPFKIRYRVHKGNINNKKQKGTKLSKYVWELKNNGIHYELKWKYIAKAKPYSPASGTCNLCTKEIFYILYRKEESSLNERNEILNSCPHRRKYKLS